MRKKRIQGRRSLGTITRMRRADRNLHFTSSLQYYSSRENENFTFTFHLVLSYPESFDEKLTSNLLYEIGLHLREEKEIQAQRRMERKKEKKVNVFPIFRPPQTNTSVGVVFKRRKRKNWKNWQKKNGKVETSWIKKPEKFLSKIRDAKIKGKKKNINIVFPVGSTTKQKTASLFYRCTKKDGEASEWNTKPVYFYVAVNFLEKRREEAWTGPELPKVKEDLTFCLDINGTALTPRGLNVAESEG